MGHSRQRNRLKECDVLSGLLVSMQGRGRKTAEVWLGEGTSIVIIRLLN